MGIKTVCHPPYRPDLAPCDFCLFPKLRGCCYETIEEMKEAVMKVNDTLTQEDFHGAFQKLLEWYNKCIAAGGDYDEGDKSFMSVLSIKVPIRKKSGNLFNNPRTFTKSEMNNIRNGVFWHWTHIFQSKHLENSSFNMEWSCVVIFLIYFTWKKFTLWKM